LPEPVWVIATMIHEMVVTDITNRNQGVDKNKNPDPRINSVRFVVCSGSPVR